MSQPNESKRNALIGCGVTAIGLCVGIAVLCYLDYSKHMETAVKKGYIVPSELEVQLKDLNGDGLNETIIIYKDKSYLFMEGEDGRPEAREYEIKPAEVVPKE